MPTLNLSTRIFIGMIAGTLTGIIISKANLGVDFFENWVTPFGQMFINLLKLIAVPIVIISLAKGISDLRDISKLSRIGGRTIFLFILTTLVAVFIGLALVNTFNPGQNINAKSLEGISTTYQDVAQSKIEISTQVETGPLDFLVNLIPENFVDAASNNTNMLQVIFFTVFFSISLLLIKREKQQSILELLDVLNDVILKMVSLIMKFAPIAVFALMVNLFIETSDSTLFSALISYFILLTLGMILILILYAVVIGAFSSISMKTFVKGLIPAQLVALTTSSSMATLPVTMECVEERLGVKKEVSSFVCPIGATLNMDATSLMQALAAVFACQVVGFELSFSQQMTIVLTASLASIGAAGAPSAGIVMLIMVLESVGFPTEQLPFVLAIILAVDRPLDMGRTVVNITGDSFVSVFVNDSMLSSLKERQDIN